MSNMSYCRFENTNIDLADCLDAVRAMIDKKAKDDQLSIREVRAAKELAVHCLEMVEILAQHLQKDVDAMDVQQLEDAIDDINDECVEKDENE